MAMPDEGVIASLRAEGQRLTPQRLLVLGVLRATSGHLTADEIFERITATHPHINRATIYRTLLWLTEQGLSCVTDLGGEKRHYQYLAARRHHHLICLGCGAQQDFADTLVAPLAAALTAQYGFLPRLDHLAVFGTCQACQQQQRRG